MIQLTFSPPVVLSPQQSQHRRRQCSAPASAGSCDQLLPGQAGLLPWAAESRSHAVASCLNLQPLCLEAGLDPCHQLLGILLSLWDPASRPVRKEIISP